MKYNSLIGILVYLALSAVCFMPWTYHEDIRVHFTGFFSQNGAYGTPGRYIVVFSAISLLMMLIPRLWAKIIHLFVAGLILAYVLKTYHLFASSYNGYTPVKQPGLYLLVLLSVASMVVALFPDMKMKGTSAQQQPDEKS